jgi:lipoate-protein ligase B
LNTVHWGLTDYADALERQFELVRQRQAGLIPDTLVLTEHRPVYTTGSRAGADKHILWDSPTRAARGVAVHASNRGGDATHHGPGQLVGYPIVLLPPERRDLHRYLRDLEEVLIRSLARYDLTPTRRDSLTGVWLENRKIAALGVAVKSWVTHHGFALNVSNDLSLFDGLIPCGLTPETGSVTTEFWSLFSSTP